MRLWARLASPFLILCFLPGAAAAQDAIVVQLQQRMIAERRLADDREIQLLSAHAATRTRLQQELAAARRRGSRAANEVAAKTRELNEALARERELLAQILQRDPASQLLIADLEGELAQLSAGASPEVRAAIAQFGAGDRIGAWPRLDAVARSGTARDRRVAARLRTIMLSYQDPGVTAGDVLQQWRAAVAADRTNSLAWMGLAQAEQLAGDVDAALEALAEAMRSARNPIERHVIAWQRSLIGFTLANPQLMVTLLREQVEATRALRGTSVPDANRRWLEQQALFALAGFVMNTGRNSEAAGLYGEAAAILDELHAADPGARYVNDALANTLLAKGNVETQLNRMDEAYASYQRALPIINQRIALAPGDAAAARLVLVQIHFNMCNINERLNRLEEAISFCDRALTLQREIPPSALRDFSMATSAGGIGRLMVRAGQQAQAREKFRYAIELWQALLAIDASPAILGGHADALHALAMIDRSICWRTVLEAWDALQVQTPLPPDQRRLYLRARRLAREDEQCPELR